MESLRLDLTPNSRFYVRNHFSVPSLDARTYRLHIGGAVQRPLDLSVKDFRGRGMRTMVSTMECAGNGRAGLAPLPPGEPWQFGAVSTARWSGVPLRSVLERAGVRKNAVEVLAIGADRGWPSDGSEEVPFARSLPIAKAMHPDTLLALEMNGEPLPPEHGAPVRLVVPGWYGVASVKWLTQIEVRTEPFAGYYQVARYVYDYADGSAPTPLTTMRVRSLIVSPGDGEIVPVGRVIVRGKAWSGEGEIAKVEVAVDGGETWQLVRLLGAASPHAWRPWEFAWDARDPGRHVLRSRATELKGNGQPDVGRWNKHGYGNNAPHSIVVNVP